MRAIVLGALLLGFVGTSSYGDFDWFNTATNLVSYADGVTPLSGSTFDSSAGVFVQLIWAGPDDSINPATNSGDGTTGDDQVHSTSWIGRNEFIAPNGIMPTFETVATDSNGYYYVRVWTAPADNYGLGLVPTATTNFYGNSALFDNTSPQPPETPNSFNFGGAGDGNNIGFAANIAVPEPSVLALMAIGLIGLRQVSRNRKRF